MASTLTIGAPTDFKKGGAGGMAMPGESDNLTEMENLTEESMLLELLMRYKKDVIYTYVGDILCAINPFKKIPGIYDLDKSVLYTDVSDQSSLPPHLFATADQAFSSMAENQGRAANQVCVISGESGAGKTESAKLFVKHIIYLSTLKNPKDGGEQDGAGLEEKIVQLNPLLESLGNAQTLMNDNSSRFGKFTELRFNGTLGISGATMTEYLLEKSRVIEQKDGERNFHIFYIFLAGVKARRDDFQLGDPGEHRIIDGNDDAIDEIDDPKTAAMYKELTDCIDIVGFQEAEIDNLFHLLAGILHLGDVEFGNNTDEDKAYIVSGDDQMTKVCTQLGVDKDAMQEALVKMTSTLRGETVEKFFKEHEANDGRDALAKAIYEKAFSWVIIACNKLLGPTKRNASDKSISILDIFGFETFDHNSLEQLLINLANEQLQYFFNEHIFSMEKKEYQAEGIDGSQVQYTDNQGVLELLLGKVGILSLVDQETKVPNGKDESMLRNFHSNLASNAAYTRPRGQDPRFTISHYAGDVEYGVDGFLEKNRDTLAIDVMAVMRLSENTLVAELFGGDSTANKKTKKKGRNERRKTLRQSVKKAREMAAKAAKKTVAQTFKVSLAELMSEMSASNPHFVRCIKPNLEKVKDTFKMDLVSQQLRYTGMLETTRIRKEGYAHRPTFQDFLNRYRVIGFPLMSSPAANASSCTRILAKAGLEDYQVGRTKVFMRYFHPGLLAQVMAPYPTNAAVIQNACRGFADRCEVTALIARAKDDIKTVDNMFTSMERQIDGFETVNLSLMDDDAMRPPDYFVKKRRESSRIKDPQFRKMQKKADKSKAGISRAQSVKWFKDVEMKKGAGQTDDGGDGGGFEDWFHGIISRNESEKLLLQCEPGAFLVRVSESRFGYSLSHYIARGARCKHYMIEQDTEGQYQVVGNSRLFGSLNELVAHHGRHKVVATDPCCLEVPCGQIGGHDDLAEILE